MIPMARHFHFRAFLGEDLFFAKVHLKGTLFPRQYWRRRRIDVGMSTYEYNDATKANYIFTAVL